MIEEAPEGRGGRPEKEGLTQVLRFDDPDELTEALQPLSPGVHARAIRSSGFRSRIRAWNLARESFFTYTSSRGTVRRCLTKDVFTVSWDSPCSHPLE